MNVITKSSFEDIKMWSMGTNFFGRPNMDVYCYLVDGVLIDTGQPRIRMELLKELKKEEIEKIVITHHHEDHSGNIEAIKELKNIEAYGSPRCVEILKKPPLVSPAQWFTWGQNGPSKLNSLRLSKPILTNNYAFEIIETPGHAEDQISLYEANKGWLFSGDIYVNDYIKVFMSNEKMDEQIKSLKKLLALDFDVLFCSHNPQFANGKKYLRAKLSFLENFYENVKKEYEKGKSEKQIMVTLKIKENNFLKTYSLGRLSGLNMVRSVTSSLVSQNDNHNINRSK